MDNIVGPNSSLRMIINMLRGTALQATCLTQKECEGPVSRYDFAKVQWGSGALLLSDDVMITG